MIREEWEDILVKFIFKTYRLSSYCCQQILVVGRYTDKSGDHNLLLLNISINHNRTLS